MTSLASGVKTVVTPEMLANWEAALDEGYAYQHVSEMYSVDKAVVRKHFPGRGWTRAQIVAHGALVRNGNRALARV